LIILLRTPAQDASAVVDFCRGDETMCAFTTRWPASTAAELRSSRWNARWAPLERGRSLTRIIISAVVWCPAVLRAQAGALQRVQLDALCVTDGTATALPGDRFAIATPASRAIMTMPTAPRAEIRFRYLGATEGSKALASGEMRRQIGLKLLAQDQCNLLYVMWRIEPASRVVVSVKRNPGMNTHAACDAHGYTNLRSATKATTPAVSAGDSHTLRAEVRGDALTVYADERVAWAGSVGSEVAGLTGPVGFRTDNAHLEMEFFAEPLNATGPGSGGAPPARCERGPED
jgi:hypothetical protein